MRCPFIIFSLLLIGGCQWFQSKPKTPEEVALAFSKVMGNLDFEAAAKLCTPETAKLMETMGFMTVAIPEYEKKEAQERVKFISSAKCNVEGSRAKCVICCDTEGKDYGDSIDLKQENGRWLVHFDKGTAASPAED